MIDQAEKKILPLSNFKFLVRQYNSGSLCIACAVIQLTES